MTEVQAGPVAGPSPREILLEAITGYVVPQVLYVATALGIADHLAGGRKGAAELTELTGAHGPSLVRLLRVLCSAGLCIEIDGAFELTELGGCLVRDAPDSVRASVLAAGLEEYRAWGELLYSVQTGEPAFNRAFGTSCYDYLAQHPESARAFDASMVETGAALWQAVLSTYDFSGVHTVVDVGGGQGGLMAAILAAHPEVRGILFDLPGVVAEAVSFLQQSGVADRCTVAGGSFFERVPAGGDVYLLVRTLLNWEAGRAVEILRTCRAAMSPAARLVVVEPVLAEGPVPLADAFNDLNLLVLGGGRMWTAAEFSELFASAGLQLTRILPAGSRLSLIEGRANAG